MRIGMASTEFIDRGDGNLIGGGTLYYRFRLPAAWLRRAGHDVIVGTLYRHSGELCVRPWDPGKRTLSEKVYGGLDLVVLQRYMNDRLADDIREAQKGGQVVASDLDDWFDGLPRSNQAYYLTHPNPVTRAEGKLRSTLGRKPTAGEVGAHLRECLGCQEATQNNRDHFRRVLAASDAVICSTPFLVDRMSELGAPAILRRNALDIRRFEFQEPRGREDGLEALWYGALGFRAAGDLDILRKVIGPWLRSDPKARFVQGGASKDRARLVSTLELRAVADRVISRGMVPIEELPSLLADVDVGLVPLEDHPFNHAKSALKGMELAARGVPYVASPLPEYEWFGQGIFARSRAEWLDALDRLRDPMLRRILAEQGRARAEEVSMEQVGPDWVADYEDIAKRRFSRQLLASS